MAITWKVKGIFKANAELVYNEIQEIGDTYTPDDIVEKAEDEPESELHKCFEWDDRKAARGYRLQQARLIMANIVVKTTDINPDAKTETFVRAIVKTEEKSTYEPITVTVTNVDSYALLLERAKSELEAFQRKYKTLSELAEIFDDIDRLLAT